MTDTSTNVALRPPRIEEGYAFPTPERRSGFLGTARAMAAPAVEAARANLAASRGGVGDYFLNMPLAALNLADAGFRGGVGAFADLIPGLSAAQRRDLAREVAAVPEAFAASVGRVPEAVDEGVGALSEVARRMFQPGPMPETLYSNPRFDAQAFLREHFSPERRAAVEGQDRRRALEANDAIRADLGLPPLNPVPRTADPVPEDFGFYQDNPALKRSSGVEWLENKQRVADETYAERRGITGSTTATLGQSADMFLPTDFLRRIPGLNNENRRPGDPRYDDLLQDVQRRGFLPDQDRNKVVLGINHRGEPFLIEGNTRVAVASDVGVPNVRVEVVYKNGGEMVDGPFSPENVSRIAARGPEGFAEGGPVFRPEPRPITLGARSTGETTSVGRTIFTNPSGDRFSEVSVTVPYGNGFVVMPSVYVENGRPRILSEGEIMGILERYGPVDIMTNERLPTFGSIEEADNYARARSDRYAQGGAVMMRSNMPEQLHRGIGSLSEVARGMFRGGEVQGFQLGGAVGGHPLDQYGQYLNQTYAEPIQRLAADAVNQFVDSVRQKEQAYFGGQMGGGGVMGSPMQGGLMGSSANPGSTLAVGGLSPTMGQVGSLSGNPLQAAMQSGTFDAQVAAAAKTPSMPSYMIAQPVTRNGPPLDPSLFAMQSGTFDAPPSTDNALSRLSTQQAGEAFASMFSTGQRPSLDPLVERQGPSPFGNSLGNQQQLGQGRMAQNAVSSGGNAYNMQRLTEQLTGQPMPSTFDGNRPGATSNRILGTFDIFQMGRNAGIV